MSIYLCSLDGFKGNQIVQYLSTVLDFACEIYSWVIKIAIPLYYQVQMLYYNHVGLFLYLKKWHLLYHVLFGEFKGHSSSVGGKNAIGNLIGITLNL